MSLYDMYPDFTPDQSDEPRFVYREADETGGLGHPTDYGQDMDDFMRAARESQRARESAFAEQQDLERRLASQRPLSAAQALVEAEVRLG